MKSVLGFLLFAICHTVGFAGAEAPVTVEASEQTEVVAEFDPFAPDAEVQLKAFDKEYERQTGESPFLPEDKESRRFDSGCYKETCLMYLLVKKSEQQLYLYLEGKVAAVWKVSTGIAGRTTPNFDRHPNGRIYTKYTSTKFPGGDYNGLGNMPYAIFIEGGFAIHGTPQSNWSKLGERASHGCIRLHPVYAKYINDVTRKSGVKNVWITVED